MTLDGLMKQILPLVGVAFALAIMWGAKMLMDRARNTNKVRGCMRVIQFRKAGQPLDELVPITNVNGEAAILIPQKNGKETNPIIHFVGDSGEFPWIWPANKSSFVQASVQGIGYIEGDAEPLTNFSDVPIISANQITNLMQGVGMAAESAMRRSQEESTGEKLKKGHGLLWVYLLLGLAVAASIVAIVLIAKNGGVFDEFYNLWKGVHGIGDVTTGVKP